MTVKPGYKSIISPLSRDVTNTYIPGGPALRANVKPA